MLFTSASIISLLAVVPAAVQAVPVFSHSDGLLPRQAADLQSKLELDPSQVATGSQQDGQGADVADNQVRSKTSVNNFANFCLTQNVPITDGQQIKTGSCNPTIMGVIASTSNMPRSKFEFPKNGQIIKSNTPFTLRMKISNLQTGNFVNPQTNYYGAPQFINNGGDIVGHSHVTIQKIDDVASKQPLDPTVFAFFKGLNAVANGGILTADVPAPGLPNGFYRMCSINTAANHQPVLVAVAQHGSLDDCVYFECANEASNDLFFNKGGNAGGAGGNNGGNGGNNNNNNGGQGGNAGGNGGQGQNNGGQGQNNGGQGQNNGGQGQNNGGQGQNNGGQGQNNGGQGQNNGGQGQNNGGQGQNNGGQGQNGNNGGQKGGQGNQGGNNTQGQAAQQAADKAKQEADAKKAAEDQKKAEEASKAAANANAGQAAAQQAADKAKQEADAKRAAEDQKKAQQQSNAANKGGKKNRRALRFQRD